MLLQIKIKELGDKYYDLMSQKDRTQIFSDLDTLDEPYEYTIVDVESDDNWAYFDTGTSVEDLTDVALLLQDLNDEQYDTFVEKTKEGFESPLDVILKITSGEYDEEDEDEG